MKKTGILLIAFIMLLGGRPPAVLAEEQHFDIDEYAAETVSEEREETSAETAEENIPSQDGEYSDEASDEETDNVPEGTEEEERQNPREYEVVTINKTGEGEVETEYYPYSMGSIFAYRFTARPAEGWQVESLKAFDDDGNDVVHYYGNSYIIVFDWYDHINVEVDFVKVKNFEVRKSGEGEIIDNHFKLSDGSHVYRFTAVPAEGYKTVHNT